MKSGSMGFSIPTSPTKIKINFSNKNHDEIIFNKENTKLQDGVFKLLAKFKKTPILILNTLLSLSCPTLLNTIKDLD